ncbi:kelch repeat-containing protein [Sphingobacterium sp. HMA12]|uniref:Kelch repeat-containing protein n=1 Tax=Sphingobacterium sp. HMA12 TaxID=2050894 RepID=UPI000CEA5ED0|nr:kelch repeat-containing protein [Sphingobacterium sp. HMA12]
MAEQYLPVVKQHVAGPKLPFPRFTGTGAIVGQYIYYLGGGSKGPTAESPNFFRLPLDAELKPRGEWEVLNDPNGMIFRTSVSSAVVGNKIYVIGGMGSDRRSTFSNRVACYDTDSQVWTDVACMNLSRVSPAVVAFGDLIYVFGGNSYIGQGAGPVKSCEVYNTITNVWSTLPDMPEPKGKHGCAVFGNKFYVVGGSGSSFVFDADNSTWRTIPCPPLTDKGGVISTTVLGINGCIFLFGSCGTFDHYNDQSYYFDTKSEQWFLLKGGELQYAQALSAIGGRMVGNSLTVYVMGGAVSEYNVQPTNGVDIFEICFSNELSLIDLVREKVPPYFNYLSGTNYLRILDTPRIWGMPFGRSIMEKAQQTQQDFERAIVEVIQKTKYRCDISSLNSPDPDWVRAILGAIDTCLTKRMNRTQPTQFRFIFGQTPMVPLGEPANFMDFKAALVRLCRLRSAYWEVMPEFWMGRFYRLGAGIISVIQAKVFGTAIIGAEDTKMTWNHTKIIAMDGTEAIVGGHNLNMDLFRSYPPVHDVSVVVHGDAAYGAQQFLNQMWETGNDLLTKESFNVSKKKWENADKDRTRPIDPLADPTAIAYMQTSQRALIDLHRRGNPKEVEAGSSSEEMLKVEGIREDDLNTLADLGKEVFAERTPYDTYDKFDEYKEASRTLTLGKYWNGESLEKDFQKASEVMKEKLIKNAKSSIKMSQMDLISAWKKNWSDHVVCQWLLEALLNNKNLQVHIVVSPLDAGAGAQGDQYSFGSGAKRTFDLLKYYMTHDEKTDQLLPDTDGARAEALTRLRVAPFYYTDQVPLDRQIEGETYKWPDLTKEGHTATLKQPPLTEKPPREGVIGSAAMSVIDASGFIKDRVESAPGNHAKIMIIDDQAYVVGSDNLYPGFLSEVNLLVEGAGALQEILHSYWDPLWKYSSPHSISG